MKSLADFTNEQLETMSKEASPRGKNARNEIERRKSQPPVQAPSDGAEDVLHSVDPDVQVTEENVEKPVKTSRKRTRKTGNDE